MWKIKVISSNDCEKPIKHKGLEADCRELAKLWKRWGYSYKLYEEIDGEWKLRESFTINDEG